MASALPPAPSVEHLKKQAKDLLRRQRCKDPAVLPTFRLLPRFRTASDDQILGSKVSLAEAQQALAMLCGYKNWQVLRRVVTETLRPDPTWPQAEYYRDFRWSQGVPRGEGALPAPPAGCGYFKFIPLAAGVRVEQYDAAGGFVRICHDPADRIYGTRKLRWRGDFSHGGAVHVDAEGKVIKYEEYFLLSHDNPPLVRAEIYNADGRLIEIHTPRRISASNEDIYVTDPLGKLKVILHHRGLDKGEPVEIEEEWAM